MLRSVTDDAGIGGMTPDEQQNSDSSSVKPEFVKKRDHEHDSAHAQYFQVKKRRIGEGAIPPTPSTVCESLPLLLDFTATTHTDIASQMERIAKLLLCNYVLAVEYHAGTAEEYEIMEVEFYLLKHGCHPDPFTHGDEEQRIPGRWYFHRVPRRSAARRSASSSSSSAGGYRGGSRKGMDLTMGGPLTSPHFRRFQATNEENRGGILFRSLRRVRDGIVISGPSLVVDEILHVCDASSVAELVRDKLLSGSAFSTSGWTVIAAGKFALNIRRKGEALADNSVVYTSPRIGLDLSHKTTTTSCNDNRIIYVQKPYRFFTHPQLLTANGRSQTFVGIYHYISDSGIGNPNSDAFRKRLCGITGLKRTVVDKYITELMWGMERGKIDSFVGPPGKGVSSSPATYLRMMGTLLRLTQLNCA